MITEEQALRQLAEANPIPDVDSLELDPNLAKHLTDSTRRSSEMTDVKTKSREDQPQMSPWRPWLIAAATVAMVGVALVIFNQEGETAPVATVETPTTAADAPAGDAVGLALAFIEARNQYDGPTMASLLAPDAQIVGELVTEPAQLTGLADFDMAIGYEYQSVECRDTSLEGMARAFCTYKLDTDWAQAQGMDPIPANNLRVIVEDGKIQNLSIGLNFTGVGAVQQGFASWLDETHPGAAANMFQPGGIAPMPILTPETIELFDRYTDEFLAAKTEDTG